MLIIKHQKRNLDLFQDGTFETKDIIPLKYPEFILNKSMIHVVNIFIYIVVSQIHHESYLFSLCFPTSKLEDILPDGKRDISSTSPRRETSATAEE